MVGDVDIVVESQLMLSSRCCDGWCSCYRVGVVLLILDEVIELLLYLLWLMLMRCCYVCRVCGLDVVVQVDVVIDRADIDVVELLLALSMLMLLSCC